MKIEVFRYTAMPIYHRNSVGESYQNLEVKVVNLSDKTRFIHGIQFELKQRQNKFFSMLDIHNPIAYPVELAPGKEFKWSFRVDDINDNNLNPIVAKEFRVFLKDTHGKEYKSKWYGVGILKSKEI